MAAFLFRFGYETPNQYRANKAHGWDDEDSQAVFIDSATAEEAESWGREIAERFVGELFAGAGQPGFSWRDHSGYAHWIETGGDQVEAARVAGIPVVHLGEMPLLR